MKMAVPSALPLQLPDKSTGFYSNSSGRCVRRMNGEPSWEGCGVLDPKGFPGGVGRAGIGLMTSLPGPHPGWLRAIKPNNPDLVLALPLMT